MLVPAGSSVALALALRTHPSRHLNAAGYGVIASTIGFVFVSVGGAGLIANLTKCKFGRARPKLFETPLAPSIFDLFAFDPDYASFPSGHATNIFALATVLGILWPRGRVLLYRVAAWIAPSSVLIGQPISPMRLGGAILGTVFPFIVRNGSLFAAGCSSHSRRRLSPAWRADAKLAWLAKGFAPGKV